MNLAGLLRSNNVVDHRAQGETPKPMARARSIGSSLKGPTSTTPATAADITPSSGKTPFSAEDVALLMALGRAAKEESGLGLTPLQEGNRDLVVDDRPAPYRANRFGLSAPGRPAIPSWMPAPPAWLPNWMFPE